MTVGEEDLIDAIDDSVTLVAVSAVQSVSEHITDLLALKQRVKQTGAMVAVDATQATGWLSLDGLDAIVSSGYKWLLSPRHTA